MSKNDASIIKIAANYCKWIIIPIFCRSRKSIPQLIISISLTFPAVSVSFVFLRELSCVLFKWQVQSTADSASKDKTGSKMKPFSNQDTEDVLMWRSTTNRHKPRHTLCTLPHIFKLTVFLRLPEYVLTNRPVLQTVYSEHSLSPVLLYERKGWRNVASLLLLRWTPPPVCC